MTSNETLTGDRPAIAGAYPRCPGTPAGDGLAGSGTKGKATGRGRDGRGEAGWRTGRLADAPWQALGPGLAGRLAELTGPLPGAAFGSGLLPGQSTLGIAAVRPPAPRS
jgi:hypothetical protein